MLNSLKILGHRLQLNEYHFYYCTRCLMTFTLEGEYHYTIPADYSRYTTIFAGDHEAERTCANCRRRLSDGELVEGLASYPVAPLDDDLPIL